MFFEFTLSRVDFLHIDLSELFDVSEFRLQYQTLKLAFARSRENQSNALRSRQNYVVSKTPSF